MGIEPTQDALQRPANGFEDREASSASVHRPLRTFDGQRQHFLEVRLGTPLSVVLAVFLAVTPPRSLTASP
jgi:hypothetical protein